MKSKAMKLILGLIFGIIFGFLLQKGGVTKYDVIINQLLFVDFTVVKIMLSAVVTGMAGLFAMQGLGWIRLRPKSGSWGRNAIGGLIFGMGFALLGYCPGTIAGAMGNGYLDAIVAGLPGIIIGSWLFAAAYPLLKDGILNKGYFGDLTIPRMLKLNNVTVVIPLAILIIALLYVMERAGV
ncbi:MAG: YeeE/YedE family protein [Deltaproteobacteria bacterium]|nr:YeeE/YedE family protein [Deltaproteobacteria bacterium]